VSKRKRKRTPAPAVPVQVAATARLPAGTIIPCIQHETVAHADTGEIIRDPIVQRDTWDDPDSVNPRSKQPHQRHGFRRVNAVLHLSKTSPGQVTAKHVAACERYHDTVDEAGGISAGADMSGIRGSGFSGGPAEQQLFAMEQLRWIDSQLGASAVDLLRHIVVGNESGTMTLSAYARLTGVSDPVAKGKLLLALDRLLEVFTPVTTGPSRHAAAHAA
jgi:hypothetical protein